MSDWDERWRKALLKEHRALFDYEKKAIKDEFASHVSCPVCDANDSRLFCEKDWFRYVECRDCGMVYLNPRLNDAATHQFYNSEANAIYNESKFEVGPEARVADDRANTENLAALHRFRGGRTGKLLEIGCADGFFLAKARAQGYEVHGLELNEPNWRASRDMLGPGILNVDLLEARYPADLFDVIYMRDLIQHIPDPKSFLRECFRTAKPGATLFIGTHNIDGLIERIVRGRYTPLFGFMEPNHFSARTLRRLLKDVGFEATIVEFRSTDFTVSEIVRHFRGPTFTTLARRTPSPVRDMVLRLVHAPFVRWPLNALDRAVTPHIANGLRRGSWMDVIAEKRA